MFSILLRLRDKFGLSFFFYVTANEISVWRHIEVQAAWRRLTHLGLQRHEYLIGFFNLPFQAPTRDNLFTVLPIDRFPSITQLDSNLQPKVDPKATSLHRDNCRINCTMSLILAAFYVMNGDTNELFLSTSGSSRRVDRLKKYVRFIDYPHLHLISLILFCSIFEGPFWIRVFLQFCINRKLKKTSRHSYAER